MIGSCYIETNNELFHDIFLRNPHGISNEKPNCIELNLSDSEYSKFDDPNSLECEDLKLSMQLIGHKNFPYNVKKYNLKSVLLILKLLDFDHEVSMLANASTFYFLPKFKIKKLIDSGLSLYDLKKSGVPVRRLLNAGYSIKDLVEVGYNLKSFRDANISPSILRGVGFSMIELFVAGYAISEIVSVRS